MTTIYIEQGKKKTFACSLEWPGWSRSGKTEEDAVQALLVFAPRYSKITDRAKVAFVVDEVVVAERVQGNATTEFGAPNLIVSADMQPTDIPTLQRNISLLQAAWELFDETIVSSAAQLRKGPRGGGRDRDDIAHHVLEAERAYGRKIGIYNKPFIYDDQVARFAFRQEIAAVLRKSSDESSLLPGGWPIPYTLRRMAWHVIDHLWEIEDRQLP